MAVRQTSLLISEFYYAMVELMEAQRRYDKAEEAYTGYSWGYAGQEYESAVNDARGRLEAAFHEAVIGIIEAENRK